MSYDTTYQIRTNSNYNYNELYIIRYNVLEHYSYNVLECFVEL